MARLITIAENAIKTLAEEIFEHGEFPANWASIDRIERRFSIQGCAETFLKRWKETRQHHRDLTAAKRIELDENAFYYTPQGELRRLGQLRMLSSNLNNTLY